MLPSIFKMYEIKAFKRFFSSVNERVQTIKIVEITVNLFMMCIYVTTFDHTTIL